jgi:hypothetical protein
MCRQSELGKVPASYKIEKDRRLVMSHAWGAFTYADAVAHKEKLLADRDFDPTYSQIMDFTHVTEIRLSANELLTFAEFDVFSRQSRRAIIAPEDVKFGLGRMFATLRESRGETGIGVFRTLEEALEWVFPKGGKD